MTDFRTSGKSFLLSHICICQSELSPDSLFLQCNRPDCGVCLAFLQFPAYEAYPSFFQHPLPDPRPCDKYFEKRTTSKSSHLRYASFQGHPPFQNVPCQSVHRQMPLQYQANRQAPLHSWKFSLMHFPEQAHQPFYRSSGSHTILQSLGSSLSWYFLR